MTCGDLSFDRVGHRAALGALLLLLACRRDAIVDLEGRPVDPLANTAPATVLLFASPSCPISNRYAPEMARLHQQFAARGVVFFLVYADPAAQPAALRTHAREHQYPFPALRDPARQLVARARATVTPEAAVFAPGGRLVYHGRIDDRFVDFGKERPAPTRRDLAEALEAVLDGRPVPVPVVPALGCAIP